MADHVVAGGGRVTAQERSLSISGLIVILIGLGFAAFTDWGVLAWALGVIGMGLLSNADR